MLEIQKKLNNLFYIILSLPATAMGFALSIQIAVLSWILSTKYHLDIHEVGIVWAAGPIAGILGQVIIGFISDKVWFWGGRRRPFILIGGVLAALMILALPNIDTINSFLGIGSLMPVAIAVAVTLDMAINISFNPTRSIIADVTPEGQQRTKGFTWMQTISGFWGVFAYIFGAIFGNYLLIYTGAFIVLVFSVIPVLFIKEFKEGEKQDSANKDSNVKNKANWPELLKLYLAHSFTWLGVQTMFVFIFVFICQFQFNIIDMGALTDIQKNEVGQIIAIAFAILNIVGFILPAPILEPLTKKIGRVRTHMLCIAIMAIGYWGIVFLGNNAMFLYIFMIIVGIGWAAVVSLPFAIMSELVDKSRMGLFMGIFNLSIVIPQLIVSLFLGKVIQDADNKTIIFMISAVSLSLSALLWLLVKEQKFSSEKTGVRTTH